MTVRRSRVVAAPPAAVWALVGDPRRLRRTARLGGFLVRRATRRSLEDALAEQFAA